MFDCQYLELKYLAAYSPSILDKVREMLQKKTLSSFLLEKHPKKHSINNDRHLREYVMALKNNYLKKSAPLSKIIYDPKIHVIHNALGLHTVISRVQGNKLKRKNEIRICDVFKNCPESFLKMIVVHELSHLKYREHDKAFYHLCEHMLPDYHQLEFEMRVYLTQIELLGNIY
ncbi:YgjP-like metallopeptidase domain-containing protein [Psychromonas sp. CD1]|uniref:YgjP-like metallopeptidase domain-containing protein n=1 Tax=Psychromonas sp. CD1 TaxID=1979839 RepID=UPI000B9A8216|nr:YgjP-like metallopeptidase domain-containing protein [Psychromonas sp. CD1]